MSRKAGGKSVIERGLKILLYLILPTTFGMVAVSRQVLALVYKSLTGAMLNVAFELMLFGGFSIIFTALMQYMIMLLQANGEFRFILLITAIGGGVKAVVSFVFTAFSSINIFALVLGNILLASIVSVLALYKLKKITNFVINFKELFVLVFGTLAMFVVVFAFINCNYFTTLANIILAVLLGVGVYFVLTIPFLLKIKPTLKRSGV